MSETKARALTTRFSLFPTHARFQNSAAVVVLRFCLGFIEWYIYCTAKKANSSVKKFFEYAIRAIGMCSDILNGVGPI